MATSKSTVALSNPQDLTGMRFGKLLVLSEVERPGKRGQTNRRAWLCQCDCGETKAVRAFALLKEHGTRSCGCLRREWCAGTLRAKNTRHGKSKTSEYGIWKKIIARCTDPGETHFKDYGGRGIAICDRWLQSFEAFHEDMGPRPSGDHSIERIDNNGPYDPGNCKWATRREQGRNKRSNRRLEHDGKSLIVADWVRITGIPKTIILSRLARGWDVSRVLTEPVASMGPRVLLSDSEVAEVRAMRGRGSTYRAISGRFGISAATACLMCTGKSRNR
jgi:hypothetical protein